MAIKQFEILVCDLSEPPLPVDSKHFHPLLLRSWTGHAFMLVHVNIGLLQPMRTVALSSSSIARSNRLSAWRANTPWHKPQENCRYWTTVQLSQFPTTAASDTAKLGLQEGLIFFVCPAHLKSSLDWSIHPWRWNWHTAWPFPGLMKQIPYWYVISCHLTTYLSTYLSNTQRHIHFGKHISLFTQIPPVKGHPMLIPVFWYPTLSDIFLTPDGIGQNHKNPEQSHILDHHTW